jgi:hypothetical protein
MDMSPEREKVETQREAVRRWVRGVLTRSRLPESIEAAIAATFPFPTVTVPNEVVAQGRDLRVSKTYRVNPVSSLLEVRFGQDLDWQTYTPEEVAAIKKVLERPTIEREVE